MADTAADILIETLHDWGVEVVFGLPGERLILRHDEQGDPGIFVAGSLLAARRVREQAGLVRGLDGLLFKDEMSDSTPL